MPPSTAGTVAALRLTLAAPVLFLILAATAIPIQLRAPSLADVTLTSQDVSDIVINVLLYVPLGLVLGRGRIRRAVLAGAALSTAAEAGQLVMLHRDPSLIDVVTNVAGTALGAWWVSRRQRTWRPLRLARWMAIPGALTAALPVLYLQAQAGSGVSRTARVAFAARLPCSTGATTSAFLRPPRSAFRAA